MADKWGFPNIDAMLDQMAPGQFAEWVALQRINADDQRRDELARRADAGVKGYRRKGG